MSDPFYDQYKTPEQRKVLLSFKRDDETEEEFWKTVPDGAWLLNMAPLTDEDIKWGERVLKRYLKD